MGGAVQLRGPGLFVGKAGILEMRYMRQVLLDLHGCPGGESPKLSSFKAVREVSVRSFPRSGRSVWSAPAARVEVGPVFPEAWRSVVLRGPCNLSGFMLEAMSGV